MISSGVERGSNTTSTSTGTIFCLSCSTPAGPLTARLSRRTPRSVHRRGLREVLPVSKGVPRLRRYGESRDLLGNVEVVYTDRSRGNTADTAIIQMLRRRKDNRALLVTRDLEIIRETENRGVCPDRSVPFSTGSSSTRTFRPAGETGSAHFMNASGFGEYNRDQQASFQAIERVCADLPPSELDTLRAVILPYLHFAQTWNTSNPNFSMPPAALPASIRD